MTKFLNYLFSKGKELQELKQKLAEEKEEKEKLSQKFIEQATKLEQVIEVRHKQEIDLIAGKSKLALKLAYYKKLLVQEKQRVTKEIENYQHELEETRKEAFQYSKQLMEVLEQREAKENKELQQDLLELNKKLETQEEITRQRQNFLEKNIKIDKVLYIERERDIKTRKDFQQEGINRQPFVALMLVLGRVTSPPSVCPKMQHICMPHEFVWIPEHSVRPPPPILPHESWVHFKQGQSNASLQMLHTKIFKIRSRHRLTIMVL